MMFLFLDDNDCNESLPAELDLVSWNTDKQKLVALEFISNCLNEVQMFFDTNLVKILPLPNYFSLPITFIKNIPYG